MAVTDTLFKNIAIEALQFSVKVAASLTHGHILKILMQVFTSQMIYKNNSSGTDLKKSLLLSILICSLKTKQERDRYFHYDPHPGQLNPKRSTFAATAESFICLKKARHLRTQIDINTAVL